MVVLERGQVACGLGLPHLSFHHTNHNREANSEGWRTTTLTRNRALTFSAAVVILTALLLGPAPAFTIRVRPAQETALDRYIAKPDPSYSWKLVNTMTGDGFKQYVLDLTSQTWRTAADVDRPTWKHWLTIVKPDKTTSNKALLFIGGGSNRDAA